MRYFIERKKKDDEVYVGEKEQRRRAAASALKMREGCEVVSGGGELVGMVEERYKGVGEEATPAPKGLGNVLKAHQVVGYRWFSGLYKKKLGGVLGDEMGVGKTLQAVSFISRLVETGVLNNAAPPALILVPLSVLQNWVSEFEKFAPNVSVLGYSGSKEERAGVRDEISKKLNESNTPKDSIFIPNVHCLITTYELMKLDDYFVTAFRYPVCVLDEGHRLKNPKVAEIFNTPRGKYGLKHIPVRFLLTGTPLQNTLTELWSLLNVACPSLFNDVEAFIENWFDAVNTDKGQHGQIQKILSHVLLRRTKQEVLSYLPPKTEVVLHCPLSPAQQKLYKAVLAKNASTLLCSAKQGLSNIVMQLRKVCNHPYMFRGVEKEPFALGEHLVLNAGKLVLLDKLLSKLSAEGRRVLIFSQFTSTLDILQDYLHLREYTYERLDGSLRASDRFAALKNFAGEGVFAFLLSTRAGGVGLNLTTADTVIFYDHDWNPQMDRQAQERVHRIGQIKPVTIYRLVTSGSVEDLILTRALKKMQLADTILKKTGLNDADEVPKGVELLELIKASAGGGEEEQPTPPGTLTDSILDSVEDATGDEAYSGFVNKSVSELMGSAEMITLEKDQQHMVYDGVDYKELAKKGEKALKGLALQKEDNDVTLSEGEAVHHSEEEEVVTPHEKEDTRRKRLKKRWGAAKYTSRQVEPVPGYPDAVDSVIKLIPKQDEPENETAEADDYEAPYHVQGDATKPRDCPLVGEIRSMVGRSVDIILAPANNSGSWGHGGFFTAVDKLSHSVGEYYSTAKDCQDLRLGDVHLLRVSREVCVCLVIAMRSTKAEYDLGLLDSALRKIHAACLKFREHGVTPLFHIPHFGTPTEWYTIQKTLSKHLATFPCFIYYYRTSKRKRHHDDDDQQAKKRPKPIEPSVESQPHYPGQFMMTSMD